MRRCRNCCWGGLLVTLAFFAVSQAQDVQSGQGASPFGSGTGNPFSGPSVDQLQEEVRRRHHPHTPENLFALLRNRTVREELGIKPTWFGQIQSSLLEFERKLTDTIGERPKDWRDREALQAYREKRESVETERSAAIESAISELLPPEIHQRLREIAYQNQIVQFGLSNVLVYGALSDDLELKGEQWDNLARKAAEFEREKQEKIRQITQEYDDKLLENLTPQQRLKFNELVGKPTALPPPAKYDPFSRYRQALQKQAPVGP